MSCEDESVRKMVGVCLEELKKLPPVNKRAINQYCRGDDHQRLMRYYWHFTEEMEFGTGWTPIAHLNFWVRTSDDNPVEAAVIAGNIPFNGSLRLPRTEITKKEFDDALGVALEVVRKNHIE